MFTVRRAPGALVALLVWLLALSLTAAAQTAPEDSASDVPPVDLDLLREDLGEDRLSGGLELMELEGGTYQAALLELWTARYRRDAARATIDATVATLAALDLDLDAVTRERAIEKTRRTSLLAALDEVAAARAEVAVAEFMGVGSDDDLGLRSLDRQLAAEVAAIPVHSDMAWEALDSQQAELDAMLTATLTRIADHTEELDGLQTEIQEGRAVLQQARIHDFVLTGELPGLAEGVRTARWATTVTAVGQPLVVVDAYVNAARTMAAEQPDCGIEWWMVAGIGAVESGHGTFGGSSVDANGDTGGTIIGIVLDGENGTAVISDSDGGALDGDPVHDRAVGPMQFIPQSWKTFGRDGNGDDVVDPHNLYDAALAAAGLLCRVDGSLSTDAGLRAALLSYNHREVYVGAVLRAAAPFRRVVIPDPPPVADPVFAPPATPVFPAATAPA